MKLNLGKTEIVTSLRAFGNVQVHFEDAMGEGVHITVKPQREFRL